MWSNGVKKLQPSKKKIKRLIVCVVCFRMLWELAHIEHSFWKGEQTFLSDWLWTACIWHGSLSPFSIFSYFCFQTDYKKENSIEVWTMNVQLQVWSGGPTRSLQRLQDSFCKRHGIRLPPLQTRFDYHSLVLLYKMRSSLAPPYLCSLLPRQASAITGYSFRKSGYPVPATRKSSTLSSFVPRSIVLWNGLPKEIQESKTLTKFKTRLRTHLQIWCQQSNSLNSRWSTLLFIIIIF